MCGCAAIKWISSLLLGSHVPEAEVPTIVVAAEPRDRRDVRRAPSASRTPRRRSCRARARRSCCCDASRACSRRLPASPGRRPGSMYIGLAPGAQPCSRIPSGCVPLPGDTGEIRLRPGVLEEQPVMDDLHVAGDDLERARVLRAGPRRREREVRVDVRRGADRVRLRRVAGSRASRTCNTSSPGRCIRSCRSKRRPCACRGGIVPASAFIIARSSNVPCVIAQPPVAAAIAPADEPRSSVCNSRRRRARRRSRPAASSSSCPSC